MSANPHDACFNGVRRREHWYTDSDLHGQLMKEAGLDGEVRNGADEAADVPGSNIGNSTEKAYSSTAKKNLAVGTDENGSVRFALFDNRQKSTSVISALQKIAGGSEEETIHGLRNDLEQYGGTNDITFPWGDKKKGIYHIAYRRGLDTLLHVIDAVTDGKITKFVSEKKTIHIEKDGFEAVLSLDEHGEKKSWLLTGWEIGVPDAIGEVSTHSDATQPKPTFSRQELGAGLENIISQETSDVKPDSENNLRFSVAPPVESKAFKEWFGNSKAVDADGKPLVVYHGTEHHFTVFSRTADWGYHFGTKTAAEKRLKNINAGEYGRIIPAYLRLENPLYLPDLQDWSPVEVARILVRKKYLTQQEVEENYLDSSLWDIRQYLIQKGYDGVVYKNRHEDRGSVSYTVFSPEQIKSADAVTYDDNGEAIPLSERFKKDNPDIRFSISPVMEIAVEYEETPTDYSNVEEFERKHAAALADTLNAGDAYDNSFSENFDEEWAAYSEEERIAVINQRYEEDIAEAKEDYEREKAANESFDRYDAFATAFEKIRDAVSPVAEEAGFEVTSKSNSAGNSFYIKLDNDEDLYTLRFSDHKQPANGSYRIRETEWGTDARRESADLDIVLQNGKFDLAPVFRFIQEKSQNNPDIRFSYPGLREMSEEDFAANPKVEAWAKVMMPEVSKGLAASDIDAAERFLTENGIDIDHVRDGALVRQAWLLAGSMYRQYRTKRNGFEAMEFYRSSHPLFDYIANFASSPDWKINPGSKYRGSEFSGTFLSPEFRKNSGALKQRKNESNADFARRQRQQTEKLDNASGIRLDEVATAYANEYGLDAISVEKEIMDLLGTLTRRDILSEYSRFKRESAFADRELERRYAEEWMLSENARIENEAAALLENAGNIEITPEWIDNNRPVYKVLYNMLFDKTAPYSPSKSDMAAINAAMRLANAPDAASDVAENTRTFNEQLQNQIDGTLPSGHVYQLGMPSAVLRSTGIPDLPIELASSRLAEKAKQQNHPFDISEIKNLPQALQNPVAVFRYGDANKAQNIIVDIQQGNKNFLVGLFLDENHRGISVNDIRGLFPKDTEKWLQWIQDGKALYLDKERIQTMIAQQRTNLAEVSYLDLDSINNIVENFENASQDSRKSAQQIAAAYKAAREQAFNEFREKLRDFKNNLNADRVDAEKLRQEAFALLEDKIPPEYRGERYSPSHI